MDKYPDWCLTCLPLPQQRCEDCEVVEGWPDGYVFFKTWRVNMNMWKCPYCGQMNSVVSTACGCFASVVEEMRRRNMDEKWPGFCVECGNRDTLSCDSCGWGQMVDGPDLWVPIPYRQKEMEDELRLTVLAVRNLRDALGNLEKALGPKSKFPLGMWE